MCTSELERRSAAVQYLDYAWRERSVKPCYLSLCRISELGMSERVNLMLVEGSMGCLVSVV